MDIKIKQYPQKRICKEFYDVNEFLKKHGAKGNNKNWHWGRWEWLIGHTYLDESTLPSTRLYMDGNEVVGLVTRDWRKQAFILFNPQYAFLASQAVDYVLAELSRDGISCISVDKHDIELINAVREKGYTITTEDEHVLVLDCPNRLSYNLDSKFSITDYHTDKNIDKYVAVIHKGFGNEGEPAVGLTESDFPEKPHENHRLAVFIVAPNGEYAAHCGTWYDPDTEICYVEPVVTIPEFRGHGLGKAVVYESINRCIAMGAKQAIVISNQQFYYRIGFQKYSVCYLWEKNV